MVTRRAENVPLSCGLLFVDPKHFGMRENTVRLVTASAILPIHHVRRAGRRGNIYGQITVPLIG
jgi:hypothetical protein